MKLNKIYSTALSGAFLLLSAASFTACSDVNDWEVDPQYDRLFHSTKFEVSAGEDDAEVKFQKMPETDYYVIEYSTDSLYDAIEMGGTEHSVVIDDKSITTSPYTLTNLEGSTKYFIRIKSCNNAGKGSTWKYLEDYSFTTKAEQIISGVVTGSTSVTVNFTPGKAVDAAYVVEGENETKYDVTVENVAAGSVTLGNLTPNTSYTVRLCNGENVRGTYKFKTTEAYPEGYEVLSLTADANLNDLLASATGSKVVVVFPQGLDYTMPVNDEGGAQTPRVPANITSIYFWGAAGAEKPTFHTKGIECEGSDKDVVRFYNLNLVNSSNGSDYIMNQSESLNINSIEMEKCNISKTRGVIRYQKIATASLGSITINDCVLTDIGSYGIINTKDQTGLTLGTVSITNTTINTVNSVLTNTSQSNFSMLLDKCTVYNCVPAGKSFFDVQKQEGVSITFTNSLIGPYYKSDGSQTVKGNSMKTIDAANTMYTSDLMWNSGYEIGSQISLSSTELWADPANGDFTVQSSTYAKYGDPRWVTE